MAKKTVLASKAAKDDYAQWREDSLQANATTPDTFATKAFTTNVSISEEVSWVISQVEYRMERASFNAFLTATACRWEFGLAWQTFTSTPQIASDGIIDYQAIFRRGGEAATPVSNVILWNPPKPIIIHPATLKIWAGSTGTGGVEGVGLVVFVKLFYEQIMLSVEGYKEYLKMLIQSQA